MCTRLPTAPCPRCQKNPQKARRAVGDGTGQTACAYPETVRLCARFANHLAGQETPSRAALANLLEITVDLRHLQERLSCRWPQLPRRAPASTARMTAGPLTESQCNACARSLLAWARMYMDSFAAGSAPSNQSHTLGAVPTRWQSFHVLHRRLHQGEDVKILGVIFDGALRMLAAARAIATEAGWRL